MIELDENEDGPCDRCECGDDKRPVISDWRGLPSFDRIAIMTGPESVQRRTAIGRYRGAGAHVSYQNQAQSPWILRDRIDEWIYEALNCCKPWVPRYRLVVTESLAILNEFGRSRWFRDVAPDGLVDFRSDNILVVEECGPIAAVKIRRLSEILGREWLCHFDVGSLYENGEFGRAPT